ncbi:hypothetical protein K435DRAFT_794153 [Dendrothele bispora CBS 962.96]|uniref:Uncharacterized protein n=1 Tax=Dendrothele bispora (strain CBS 962.96) TaxID=1314807 RepID=A0A4S8MDI1_DENBC|nr:hypothetical protein K435DRAFT_794153 [Dendrothele bispora CBS 962.96]
MASASTPQANSKKRQPELEVIEDTIPFLFPQKVRLITQPGFGHELRQAQQTIADLRGQVAHWEWEERKARRRAMKLEDDLAKLMDERDGLVEELKQMQESENDEVQRLGDENITLFRRVSHSDIELQTLRDVVQALTLSEVTNGVSSIPGHLADTNKDEVSAHPSQDDDITQEGSDNEIPGHLVDANKDEVSAHPSQDDDITQKGSDNEAEPTTTHRLIYPLDALSSVEAEKWFPQAFGYVDVDLGPRYKDLLLKWIDFERIHQWEKTGGRLDKTERPKEITAWITEGRYAPRCKGPNVGADFVKTFPDDFRKWWDFLRSSSSLPQQNDDWTSLTKYGINGWFSIVVGMKWWGEGLKSLSGDGLRNGTEEWFAMITEVATTLDMLIKYLERERSSVAKP